MHDITSGLSTITQYLEKEKFLSEGHNEGSEVRLGFTNRINSDVRVLCKQWYGIYSLERLIFHLKR